MSTGPKKSTTKKATTNTGSSTTKTASVRDIVARASHLREVVAIVRAASSEYIIQFADIGQQLPELLLQRDGGGARPASAEAIIEAESALEGIARELEARANALLSAPVESSERIEHLHAVTGIGEDRVVRRDRYQTLRRTALETKT